jgi:hypothetical protein
MASKGAINEDVGTLLGYTRYPSSCVLGCG